MQIVELIREDLATTLVFLELPHEPIGNISPSLNALNIGDIIRHTRLQQFPARRMFQDDQSNISTAAQRSGAMLFGFDQANHV